MRRSFTDSIAGLVLIGAVLAISLNTWIAISAVERLEDTARLVSHTWEVLGQIQRLLVSSGDAEATARYFVLSGDSTRLGVYASDKSELAVEVSELRRLTSDNPGQQHRLQHVEGLLRQRTAQLDGLVEGRRFGRVQGSQSDALSLEGSAQMTALSSATESMVQEENRLLRLRQAAARRSHWVAVLAVGLASMFDFLFVIALYRYFERERVLRLGRELAAEEALAARAEALRSAEEVQQLNAELEERVRRRTAELETTNRELEAFSYSVSHDLRAPLRTIDGFSLALEEDYAGAVDATGRDYIRRVRFGVQRMGSLIDALLQLSRITRAEIQREPVDLTAIAETVAEQLRQEHPGSDLRFRIEPGMRADADPKLLQVALENLMGNAVKFSSKKEWSEIEVSWDAEQNAWRISDNGAGFDMHYRDKLFNAFNRLHGDKDFKGSGIGLATVARVVRRHHGKIWAEGRVGSGASFWFTLG